ncbi:self-incompatibility protein S1-like [Rhodamnia argentea]|uniref:S-protein homolog n=1 Tax=Rhodamnia argentea TaxID=178133 RepID=A0A8B8MVY5_9MYRT|nr:self-incompatibility protein S1-like [Rhodamnia argentea]
MMNTTVVKKLNPILLLTIAISTIAVSGYSVHTINRLGNGKALKVHCTLDLSMDMGEQTVADGGSYEWKFSEDPSHDTQLLCNASTLGADVLHFAAYVQRRDPCVTTCDWKFTGGGVFHLVDGQWEFYFSWPSDIALFNGSDSNVLGPEHLLF